MATEEHILLAQYLKSVHANLRKTTSEFGWEAAWTAHCKNKEILKRYATCMEKLANTYWQSNCASENSSPKCRINWATDLCRQYFICKDYILYGEKEKKIATKMNVNANIQDLKYFSEPYKLLDVGSCYNPFNVYSFFKVLAIDLYPANDSVLYCDFLSVEIGLETKINDYNVIQLQHSSFDVVTFCFLLEYLPNAELRIRACEKAYEILKPGGLLIINTPDSKHVGANCKIMKCWRYALACMGFMRIKYEKFKHMHCMAFRKALNKEVAMRWADIHKEPYMSYAIHIPQDNNSNEKSLSIPFNVVIDMQDFQELPFHDV